MDNFNAEQLRVRTETELWILDALPELFGKQENEELPKEFQDDAQAHILDCLFSARLYKERWQLLVSWLKGVPDGPAKVVFMHKLLNAATSVIDAAYQPPRDTVPSDCSLIVFDFDGTIVQEEGDGFGLSGARLQRLLDMSQKIRSSECRCVLVTAQLPQTTEEVTLPVLHNYGLAALFDEVGSGDGPDPCTYWEDPTKGTIYNDEEAMGDKIRLISKIIRGFNCWRVAFDPSKVLFVDDRQENFQGYESLGINVHLVSQDGMNDDDCSAIEAFLITSGASP